MDKRRSRGTMLDEPSDEYIDPTLASVIREHGAEIRARREPHPDPEALIEYSQGEVDPVTSEQIRAHLASCRDCARTVLDLGELARFDAALESFSSEETAVHWRDTQQKLAQSTIVPNTETTFPVVSFEQYHPAARSRRKLAVAWVAGLAAAVFLILIYGWRISTPQPNVHVASLIPSAHSYARDTSNSLQLLRIPKASDQFILILNLADSRVFPHYRLEALRIAENEEAKSVWRGEDLVRTSTGNFTIAFDRRYLPPGYYTFELSGLKGSEATMLARFTLELVYE